MAQSKRAQAASAAEATGTAGWAADKTLSLMGNGATAVFTRGAEAWLNAQSELLVRFETAMQDWVNRQHEAIQESYRALHRLRECRDLAEAALVQQDWLAASVRRMASDLGALGTNALDASRTAFRHVEDAGEATADGARRVGDETIAALRAAAGGKPAENRR